MRSLMMCDRVSANLFGAAQCEFNWNYIRGALSNVTSFFFHLFFTKDYQVILNSILIEIRTKFHAFEVVGEKPTNLYVYVYLFSNEKGAWMEGVY